MSYGDPIKPLGKFGNSFNMTTIQDLQKFYKNKRVFITGHTGFKGSWLVLWLRLLGANVHAYSLPAEGLSLFNICNLDKDIKSNFGNITDLQLLKDALQRSSPEIVIHMAAQAFVLKSYKTPYDTYSTNVMGTINLFEAIRNTESVKAVLNVTSDKCYENNETNIPFVEEDKLGGADPYSSSKACSEIITSCWRNSYFTQTKVNLATARAGNVIGGGDFSQHRIIPDIIRSIERNERVLLRNPNAVRPWQYVIEPLCGYLLLCMKLFNEGDSFNGAYNFGPDANSALAVKDVTKLILRRFQLEGYDISGEQELKESTILLLNSAKARVDLNWSPLIDIEETIKWTADWYENYFKDRGSAYRFSINQIEKYCELL
jgi:CDP-glucose 4,6-dehydratase